MASLVYAQPPQVTSESQARYYVYGAFLTHAVPEIMGQNVALGSELEQRLGLKPGADRLQIYDALMTYTDGKRLAVRKASAEELARYKPQTKRELNDLVFTVQAGEITLLVEYDLQANAIPFVGQLGAAPPPPQAAAPAPRVEQRAASPAAASKPAASAVAAVVPKPAPVKAAAPPPAASFEMLRPNGPCMVKPVMSEQDLANCRAAPGAATRVQPGPPVVVKPQAALKPAAAPVAPQRTGPCEVKPVMTDEDLANCRNAPAARVQPAPTPTAARPAATTPQAAVRPAVTPCVIKPVMSEEDRLACGIR